MILCPRCLKQSIIATVDGPTCSHANKSDSSWFPVWWSDTADDKRRCEYLELNQPSSHIGRDK